MEAGCEEPGMNSAPQNILYLILYWTESTFSFWDIWITNIWEHFGIYNSSKRETEWNV